MKRKDVQVPMVTAAIRVESATLQYSFGKRLSRLHQGRYDEFTALECKGTVESSKDFAAAPIDITILASREIEAELSKPESDKPPALAVGEFRYRKGENYCFVSMPFSALWRIAPEVREGRLPYLVLRGTKMRGGKMSVSSMAFDTLDSLEDHGLERP
jgi:hypothetical protein